MSIFDELTRGVVAATAADMRSVAARLAHALPADRVLALAGDMGVGKTTFVQGLASAWGVRETVTSPTFAVCNLHRGTRLLVHVDAYRLGGPAEWDGLMIEEFLRSPWCLVVEWPERIQEVLAASALWLVLEMRADGTRFLRAGKPAGPFRA